MLKWQARSARVRLVGSDAEFMIVDPVLMISLNVTTQGGNTHLYFTTTQ